MLNKIKKVGIDEAFIKFVIVGLINTLFGTTVMFLLYNFFGCSYYFSSFCNYFFGSIISYFLNKYFTFNYRRKNWKVVVKFILNISICYLISYGIARPLTRLLLSSLKEKIVDNIAMIIGMLLFIFCNYFGQRFVVFSNKIKNEI